MSSFLVQTGFLDLWIEGPIFVKALSCPRNGLMI